MYNFKFSGIEAIFKSDSTKLLKCPEKCKKQIKGDKYWFQKNTQKLYNISFIMITEVEKKTDDKVATRIWESLRAEGWR